MVQSMEEWHKQLAGVGAELEQWRNDLRRLHQKHEAEQCIMTRHLSNY